MSGNTKSINFMGLASVYMATIQDPYATKLATDSPVDWTLVGEFLQDSVSAGRDDATMNDIMVEERDDSIFTDYTNQPFKMTGNSPNLSDTMKAELGGYVRRVADDGTVVLDAPKQAPNVVKMIKVVPKNGKFSSFIIYNGVINVSQGDNLSKTESFNDKITLTALAPTKDMVNYAQAGSYAFIQPKNTDAIIQELSTVLQVGDTIITEGATNTVSVTVETGTDVTAIKPYIVISDGASVSPASDVATDFSTAVAYTVTAEDGVTTKVYQVSVVPE